MPLGAIPQGKLVRATCYPPNRPFPGAAGYELVIGFAPTEMVADAFLAANPNLVRAPCSPMACPNSDISFHVQPAPRRCCWRRRCCRCYCCRPTRLHGSACPPPRSTPPARPRQAYANTDDRGFMLVTLDKTRHRLEMQYVNTVASADVSPLPGS